MNAARFLAILIILAGSFAYSQTSSDDESVDNWFANENEEINTPRRLPPTPDAPKKRRRLPLQLGVHAPVNMGPRFDEIVQDEVIGALVNGLREILPLAGQNSNL